MHAPAFVAFLVSVICWSSRSVVADIETRNLIQFYGMIKAATGKTGFDFNNYGNWCGVGGKGEPVDDVDRCCMNHDKCYYRINRAECEGWLHTGAYLVIYNWDLNEDGQPICLAEQKNECAEVLCECDHTAATCFGKSEYHPENKH